MELISCEYPVRVYNKYIDEYVWTSCGHCNACKKRRAARWVARLEAERRLHPVSLFVTLTYNEPSLPLLQFNDEGDLLVSNKDSLSIPFDEMVFSSVADKQYFDSRMALGGIPYASVVDIQKFHKRLNKWFHDNVTQTYKNFRYFTVSEFGSTTLRPHFHSIYFTDSLEVASHFEEGVCACWQFGISDTQYIEKSANSYVAQYLNELFDLPSFYHHSKIRPFFVCSKQPPIGMRDKWQEDFKEIFDSCSPTRLGRKSSSDTTLSAVPLQSCVENRLFPRLPFFRYLPNSLRASLYGLVAKRGYLGFRWYYQKRGFMDFLAFCQRICLLGSSIGECTTSLREYLSLLARGFNETGINCLKRFYYISKRVVNNAIAFGVTIEQYVDKIDKYWSNKELYVLKQFYSSQEKESDPEVLIHCYPETVYQHDLKQDCWILSLQETTLYKNFVQDNAYLQDKHTKSHFKNMYFESLKQRNNPLFNIILTYLYAKKCNEVIEAFGKPCSK